MKYYSHVISLHRNRPFHDDTTRYTTWLGEFVKPVAELQLHQQLWFSQYGDHVRLRLFCAPHNYARIAQAIDQQMARLALQYHQPHHANEASLTLEDDLGNPRFLTTQKQSTTSLRTQRAKLVLNYLNSIAELVLDNLQRKGNDEWILEQTPDDENPTDYCFDSLLHLMGNMTDVPFPIVVPQLATPWGPVLGQKVHIFCGQAIQIALLRY